MRFTKIQTRLYWSLCAIVFLSSIYCIIYNIVTEGKVGEFSSFTRALQINPNFYAIAVVLSHLFLVNELVKSNKKFKMVKLKLLLLLFFSIILVLLTSRMAFIALIFAMLFLGIVYTFNTGKRFPLIAIVLLVGVMVSFLSQTHIGGIRFRNISKHVNNFLDNPLQMNRFQTIEGGVHLIKREPIWGNGIENMQKRLNRFYDEKKYAYVLLHEYHIHNQFIQFGAIGGVGLLLGLIMFIWLPVMYQFNVFDFLQSSIFSLVFMTDSPLMDWRIALLFFLLGGSLWTGIFLKLKPLS